jgi:hypothetical protein
MYGEREIPLLEVKERKKEEEGEREEKERLN